ncbi:MAG: xanthine dehydrogenase family protein subunit M, partial [Pseudomonadota bacterium]
LMTAILIPAEAGGAKGVFLKLGARTHLVISIAMVAAAVEVDAGIVARARVAVGSCSAVAARLPTLEAALVGRSAAAGAPAIEPAHLAPLAPIDDVRADAAYRREAAAELCRRALAEALGP